jgi:hypothetical protein
MESFQLKFFPDVYAAKHPAGGANASGAPEAAAAHICAPAQFPAMPPLHCCAAASERGLASMNKCPALHKTLLFAKGLLSELRPLPA